MHKNFEGPLKIKGRPKFVKISGVTCPNQGLFIYNIYRHLYLVRKSLQSKIIIKEEF
jgi:hypothetical protein